LIWSIHVQKSDTWICSTQKRTCLQARDKKWREFKKNDKSKNSCHC